MDVCTVDLVERGAASDARSWWLRARGALSARGAELLEAVLAAAQERGARYVRLDLCGVTAVDQSGLAVLVRAHRGLLNVRGTLVLTGVGARLHRDLAAAGLDRVLLAVQPTAAARAAMLPGRWIPSLPMPAGGC